MSPWGNFGSASLLLDSPAASCHGNDSQYKLRKLFYRLTHATPSGSKEVKGMPTKEKIPLSVRSGPVRHVKCDEEKPACTRCTSTGRKCDGYASVTDKRRRSQSPVPSSHNLFIAVQRSPSPEFHGDHAELRSFHYFRSRTAFQLSGYFISDFWDCLVPLLTHQQPAIRHAVLALSSLHERFEKSDTSILNSNSDVAQGGFALQQYNRAIGCLINPVITGGQQTLEIFLVACILFACFETLRGHYASAISHIQNGVNIISSANQVPDPCVMRRSPLTSSSIPCVSIETLKVIFARLDYQSKQLVGGPPMPLSIDLNFPQPGFGPRIPAYFTSLEEAQNSLCYHQSRHLKAAFDLDGVNLHTDPVGPLIEGAYQEKCGQRRDHFRGILQRWSSAFEAFFVKASITMDSKALQGAAVLVINHRISSLNVDYQRPNSWDHLQRECGEIVDLATSIVKPQNESSSDSPSRSPVFFMEMNTVGPLFSIATQCRDPVIRRKAIALLYSNPRQEGVWHSVLTARVAERIMIVEEAGLGEIKGCEDVPEENRISDISVRPDMQGRKGYVKCGQRQCTGQDVYVAQPILQVFEEVIEW